MWAGNVAQLVWCLLVLYKSLGSIPCTHKPAAMVHAYNPSTYEGEEARGSEVQDNPQLHSELRPALVTQNTVLKKSNPVVGA